MDSHLGGGTQPPSPQGNIHQINAATPEFRDGVPVDMPPPSGGDGVDYAYARDIPRNRPGQVASFVSSSPDIRSIKGSNTQLGNADQSLPPNEMHGSKWVGSTTVVSAEELDARDRQHGTSTQPLKPGVYALQDGNILCVYHDGRRIQMTPAEYNAAVTQQRVQQQAPKGAPQQPTGLVSRLLGALRK